MRAEEILERGLALLKSKGEDYTEDRDVNQYQNFERSNLIASWFKYDEDKSFAVLIGTKLARLATLLNSNKGPNNESILDSFIDGSNYFALWGGKRASKSETEKPYESHQEHTKIRNEYQRSTPVQEYLRTDFNIGKMFNPNQPAENKPEPAQQTNAVCPFCRKSIDPNDLRFIGYYGREAHIGCLKLQSYDTQFKFAKSIPY